MKDTNMTTEKETSNHINAVQSYSPLEWETHMTWCEDEARNRHSPEDIAEVLRDSLKYSIPYLRRSELRERLGDWITLAVEAIIFYGQQSERMAESLSKDELEEELHEWVCLTLRAVRAGAGAMSIAEKKNPPQRLTAQLTGASERG
jgi:hypothetical protein